MDEGIPVQVRPHPHYTGCFDIWIMEYPNEENDPNGHSCRYKASYGECAIFGEFCQWSCDMCPPSTPPLPPPPPAPPHPPTPPHPPPPPPSPPPVPPFLLDVVHNDATKLYCNIAGLASAALLGVCVAMLLAWRKYFVSRVRRTHLTFARGVEERTVMFRQARRPLGPWDEEHLQVAEDDSYANAMEMTEMVDLRADRA